MNFDEAARNFQITPFPNYTTASFDLHYNMNLHQPKESLHSRSNTISDDNFGIKIRAQHRMDKKDTEKECGTPQTNMSNSISDTYDDDMDTETEDYLSDHDDDDDDDNDETYDPLDANDETKDKDEDQEEDIMMESPEPTKKPKSRVRSRTLSRPRTTNIHFLRIPNESDDNFDDDMSDLHPLDLPIINNKLHIRSYSESNIQKTIQNNQWPSSESSDDSFDFNTGNDVDSTVYSRYVSVKKKYKKQRRISQQFQDAITVIQDENEDVMQQSEDHIRAQFENEYEIKLIELEHHKLNNAMNIEDKMKQVLLKNDELILRNQQLQNQVAAQVAMIQEQQHIALQQQRSFLAMQTSVDTMISPVSSMHSPFATLNHYPSAHALLRRVSSASTINTVHTLNNMPSMNKSLGLGLTPMSSNGEMSYTLNDDVASVNTDVTNDTIHDGHIQMYNKHNIVNMDLSHKYRQKNHKKYQVSQRKKLKDIEKRLLHHDDEAAKKIGSGQSPWDRFLDLMTPSFCSCSPNIPQQNQQKSITTK